ncbi:MAG: hypothetical protein LUG96_14125 [Tannerellaceae bacterium]|nr:hypothetical protein [Tannerellaceae bacterium]
MVKMPTVGTTQLMSPTSVDAFTSLAGYGGWMIAGLSSPGVCSVAAMFRANSICSSFHAGMVRVLKFRAAISTKVWLISRGW